MKKIIYICTITTLLLSINIVAFATGYEGMAVYRDGVSSLGIEINWHAGICTTKDLSGYKPVIHIGGKEDEDGNKLYVDKVKYEGDGDTFMGDDDNEFKGVYWDDDYSVDYYDDYVEETAFDLLDYDISYCFMSMLEENDDCSGSLISPREIGKIRCDGVVEYCFEYNNIKVQDGYYGEFVPRYYWDISDRDDCDKHSILYGPKGQARQFLELKSDEPW